MTREVNKAGPALAAEIDATTDARLARLQRVRVVLVQTSLARNIGSVARAMRAMGLTRLYLVNPAEFPHPEANVLASGADHVLDDAVVCTSLEQALADCVLSFGTSARDRRIPIPEMSPRAACSQAVQQLDTLPSAEIALVFGSERMGLQNDELNLCQARVQIPTDHEFNSLNLAQAVQLLAYELRLAMLDQAVDHPVADHHPAATIDFERMIDHWAKVLDQLGFHGTRNPDLVLTRLRRLLQRGAPDQREVQIMRGICSEIQYKLGTLSAQPTAQDDSK
jgi:tRNA (cytidine32/uridine32-2'-O)-methyltransferase